jgi:amino acid transporter, AAT family
MSDDGLTEEGLHQGLNQRHIRMIGIGGAMGTGLFLAAGGAISKSGPALAVVYAVTGVFIFIIMRALGELLLYRPVAGSFAEYARELLGPAYGFITGWGYWTTQTVIGMAELTAAGIYINYWFPQVPQWLTALVMLSLLILLNLLHVGAFGEAEFWFAGIKISAILTLIIGGVVAMVFGIGDAGTPVNLINDGGLAPHGLLAALLAFQIGAYSYQGVELVGMTAAEAKDRENVLPKAINSIPWRIGIFYVASLLVLMSLFPWNTFSTKQSLFVQAFAEIGIPAAGGVMNFVVLTAALSSCSSGLFSNGRLLKRLSEDGIAPAAMGRTNRKFVPAFAIVTSGCFMMIAVVVNYVTPSSAFNVIAAIATLGAIWSWGIIVCCHLSYRRKVASGERKPSPFRLPFATPLCIAVLVFLAFVMVLLGFDQSNRIALYALPIWAAALVGAYFLFGKKAMAQNALEAQHPTAQVRNDLVRRP